MTNKIEKLVRRLKNINIEIELVLNYPWVYITKINGKQVTETYYADHGFTVCFLTESRFLSIRKLFKLLRKYSNQFYYV
jgi:hypothetical protein